MHNGADSWLKDTVDHLHQTMSVFFRHDEIKGFMIGDGARQGRAFAVTRSLASQRMYTVTQGR
jgi:hypothetical protein